MTILAVDDELCSLESIRDFFSGEYQIEVFSDPRKALSECRERHYDVILVDQRMPYLSGLELLLEAKKLQAYSCGIMLTAYADKNLLVQVINQNLIQFILEKPIDMEVLTGTLLQAEEYVEELRKLSLDPLEIGEIIGLDGDLAGVSQVVKMAAPTNENILITGETGTGKEMFARKIHRESLRSSGPFIKINCASIPDHLLESELFGYARGAFTGASTDKKGKIVAAHRGTLFLDEIAEIKAELQSKLLAVLQDRKVEPLGSNQLIPVDFRLIAATNRNIELLVLEENFRADLFYRLNTVHIHLPPLRERKKDILRITQVLLRAFAVEFGRPGIYLTPEATNLFTTYPWPGNIRELENALKRAIILLPSGTIAIDETFFSFLRPSIHPAQETPETLIHRLTNLVEKRLLPFTELEDRVISELLDRYKGNIPEIVRATAIPRDRLYRRKNRLDFSSRNNP